MNYHHRICPVGYLRESFVAERSLFETDEAASLVTINKASANSTMQEKSVDEVNVTVENETQ